MLKKLARRAGLIIFSLLLCLFLLELTLRTGWFDDENNSHPVWIPHKFDKLHHEIENSNWQFAKQNPYKFTDKVRSPEKEKGVKRIAILGDSFVWGTGIPYRLTWNHQLEQMITEKYQKVEVLHWGFPAWSTMDELSFLENHGLNYDIDILLVGYVDNDPHMQRIELKVFSWHKSAAAKALKIFFPNAISFIRAYLYTFLFRHFTDYGYANWVKKLHSQENLVEYGKLLRDFAQFCHSHNIKLLFALTPSNHDEIYGQHFDKVIPLLEEARIEYVNLYPESKRELGRINVRKLWANPGDPHPGEKLTNLFARHILTFMEEESTLDASREYELRRKVPADHDTADNIDRIKSLVSVALHHDDLDRRREAVFTLASWGNSAAFELFTTALMDQNPRVREAATYALGIIPGDSAVDYLLTMLKDADSSVRRSAVLALGNLQDPRVTEALKTVATQDRDEFVRRRALLLLTKFEGYNLTDTLIRGIKDEFFYNRKTALIAIGKLKDPLAVEPVINALFDDVVEVRLAAAEALGEIKDTRAVDTLKSVSLKDDNPLVRDFAAAAIKKITGKDYAKYRRKLLRMWQEL